MAKIAVVGGTGYAGGHLVAEAAARGHEVVSVSRSVPAEGAERVDGVEYVSADLLDADAVAGAIGGSDVILSAVSPRGPLAGKTRGALVALADVARDRGARLGVIGGAGSLFVAEGGPKLIETPEFPDAFKEEATEMGEVLDDLRARTDELDWFFVSPAAAFGAFNPGERRGEYRLGGDVLVADEDGNSDISGADLAIAIIDEVEKPAHRKARFTAAY